MEWRDRTRQDRSRNSFYHGRLWAVYRLAVWCMFFMLCVSSFTDDPPLPSASSAPSTGNTLDRTIGEDVKRADLGGHVQRNEIRVERSIEDGRSEAEGGGRREDKATSSIQDSAPPQHHPLPSQPRQHVAQPHSPQQAPSPVAATNQVAADHSSEAAAGSPIDASVNAHQQAAENQRMPASEQDTKAESIAVDAPQAAAITSLPGIVATEPEAKRADESSGNADNGGDLGQQAGAPNVSDTNLAAAGVVVADAAVAAKEATPLHANAPAAASVTDATTRHEAPPTTTHDASTQQQQEQPKQQQQQQAPQQEQPPQQQQTEKAVESPTTSNLAPAETAKASAEATAAAAAAGEKKDAAKDKAGSREPTLMDSYTELFNYASLECGAKLLAANEDAQGASNVLSESRERYTMSPCGSERWLVIELCEEVGLTAFEVANFEYFSSTFKDIQLFGSHSWPSATWVHIGNFTAQNAKKIQHFSLPETVWFKYVKVVFLTHYGSQYYCPVSVVRIHGTSHVANLKEKMISNSKEIGQRINEIKSKHKPKDPNKDASVPASPTTHPVVINDDATVPKKDTTLPKEVADLAQAGNHAAAAGSAPLAPATPGPVMHDAQPPSGTTTSTSNTTTTAPPASAPASTATTVAAAPLVGDVSPARDSSLSTGQPAVKDAPAAQDHPGATAAATSPLEPAQPQDQHLRPDQKSVALDTPLPASSSAHQAPATADATDQRATAAVTITAAAPSAVVSAAPQTTAGAAVGDLTLPQRPMTNVSTAQQVAQQLAAGNGEPLIMDPTRPLSSSEVDLATFTAAPPLPAATTGPAAAAADSTAPTTAPDVVAPAVQSPVAITGNTTTTTMTTTTTKTMTETATAASAPTTGAGVSQGASSANAETEPPASAVTVTQPNLKADEPAGEPPTLSDTAVAAAPTVAAAVLPASDSVDSTAHSPTGQVVSGPPVVAEPHAPMAADERAASAAAVAAEQPPEQAAALVVEPSPAMRVSMTRLMLEELPQLVDEDFNTQESIFTTLANRMKTLEINQHLLNAYLEGVVAKHLEAYDEVAVELDKFNNERHSIVSTLHNAVKSNAQMREEHAKIMDTWRQELAEATKSLEARLTAECRHDTQQTRAKMGHDSLEQLVLVALVAAATHLLIHIVRRCVAWCHAALRRRAIGQRDSRRKKDDDHDHYDNASARARGKPEDSEEGSESDDGNGGEAGAWQRYPTGSLSDGDGSVQHRWTLVRRNRGGRKRRGTGDGKEKCERPPPPAEDSDHPSLGERARDDVSTRKRRRRQVRGDHDTESESENGGGEAGGDRRRSCEDTAKRRPDHRWSPPSSKRPAATQQQQRTLHRATEHEQATTNSSKQPGHANNKKQANNDNNDKKDSVGRKGGKKRSTSADATAPYIGSRPPQKSRSFGL